MITLVYYGNYIMITHGLDTKYHMINHQKWKFTIYYNITYKDNCVCQNLQLI